MIRVRVGSDERDMTGSVDEQWINQEINRRRAAGESVCVRVTIHDAEVNVALATPTCGGWTTPFCTRPHDCRGEVCPPGGA